MIHHCNASLETVSRYIKSICLKLYVAQKRSFDTLLRSDYAIITTAHAC
jgi:hypothetical protein